MIKDLLKSKETKAFVFWLITFISAWIFIFLTWKTEKFHYPKFLFENFSIWVALINSLIFGFCFVFLPVVERPIINNILSILFLLSALTLRLSFEKAPNVTSIIWILSLLLFALKSYYKRKKLKPDKDHKNQERTSKNLLKGKSQKDKRE